MKLTNYKLHSISDINESTSMWGRNYITATFKDEFHNSAVVYMTEGMRNIDSWNTWYNAYGEDYTTQWDLTAVVKNGKPQLTKSKSTVCDGDNTPTMSSVTPTFGNDLFSF